MADVIASMLWQMELPLLADVIANMADGIAPSPIYDHSTITGHNANINNFSIVGREEHNLSRLIKESMFIRVNNPSFNKNIGKYHLPHVWDEVLINNIELKLK